MKRLLVLSMALVVFGCKGDSAQPLPETISECKQQAGGAANDTTAARTAGNADRAAALASRAEKLADHAEKLLRENPDPGETDRAASRQARLHARSARRTAALAGEDKRLAGLLSGWKARSYRAARNVAFAAALRSLAGAARRMQSPTTQPATGPARDAAMLAADLAEFCTGRQRLGSGRPDWKGVAGDLDAMAAAPPPTLAHLATMAYLMCAQNRLALYEIELADPRKLTTQQENIHYRLVRGVALSMNGFPRLAAEQLSLSGALMGQGGGEPELVGLLHLYLAMMHLRNNEPAMADADAARALRVWPNNPLAVFLTGERLAADGRTEKAAESLEAAAADSEYKWLAEAISERARTIRDGRAEDEPLILDRGFLTNVALRLAAEKGRSAAVGGLRRVTDTAGAFGRKLMGHLPARNASEESSRP